MGQRRNRKKIGDLVSHHMPRSWCAGCLKLMDAATNVDPHAKDRPVPGCFTICFNCGTLHIYTRDLTLRAATRADVADAPPDLVTKLATITGALVRYHDGRRVN